MTMRGTNLKQCGDVDVEDKHFCSVVVFNSLRDSGSRNRFTGWLIWFSKTASTGNMTRYIERMDGIWSAQVDIGFNHCGDSMLDKSQSFQDLESTAQVHLVNLTIGLEIDEGR